VLQDTARGKVQLQYYSRASFEDIKRSSAPSFGYTIDAGQLEAASAGDISVVYWRRPIELVEDTDTNELLTAWPNLYLFGALMYVAIAVQDTETEALYSGRYNAEMTRVRDTEARARASGDTPTMIAR
jgi:hypothetical protein